jgi:tetraacyldisaccharide 4'-kinase
MKHKHLNYLFTFGRPFSPLYGFAMKLREKLYRRGFFQQQQLPVPVISVGNLVLGGTGKTPTVIHIAKLLVSHGYRPAIVSRGYGGKVKPRVGIVSDGTNIRLSPDEGGDEPVLIAKRLEGVPVLTGAKRIFPCWHAVTEFKADCIILDDGFQHLSVQRDLDIVLFDSTSLVGNSRIFPGGPLREPVSALERCDTFLLTGRNSSNRDRAKRFSDILCEKFPEKSLHTCSPSIFLRDISGNVFNDLGLQPTFGFCGIANPERFSHSLRDAGINLTGFESLNDHMEYTQALTSELADRAIKSGAKYLVTTEKDSVKLEKFSIGLPLIIATLDLKVDPAFDELILEKVLHFHDSGR